MGLMSDYRRRVGLVFTPFQESEDFGPVGTCRLNQNGYIAGPIRLFTFRTLYYYS